MAYPLTKRHAELALVHERVHALVPVVVDVQHEAEPRRGVHARLRRLPRTQFVRELHLRRCLSSLFPLVEAAVNTTTAARVA